MNYCTAIWPWRAIGEDGTRRSIHGRKVAVMPGQGSAVRDPARPRGSSATEWPRAASCASATTQRLVAGVLRLATEARKVEEEPT
jgi:hypothetical protein